MKFKILFVTILVNVLFCDLYAQKEFSIGQISVINLGDGRLLFRSRENDEPIEGKHRIIDGYKSEYILAEFSGGLYDGTYEFFKHNKLSEKGTYKDGLKNGDFIEYYSDGVTIKSEKKITNGKIDGIMKTYYTDGKTESEKGYKNGLEDGIERRYNYETGKMTVDCNYLDGKPDGKQMRHISSNVGDYVQISHYIKGIQTGDYSETWTNGKVRIQGKYKDGKKDGVWIENRKDGKPERSISYKNGLRDGEYKTFYTDGTIEKTTNYINDLKEGLSKEFHYDSGNIKAEYNYSNDIKEGKYKLYYDDGTTREEGRCENGKEIYRKEYYRNGKVKEVSERTSKGGWETIERYDSEGKQL